MATGITVTTIDADFGAIAKSGEIKIRFKDRAFVKIMKDRATQRVLLAEAQRIASDAGPGMKADMSRPTPTRARARVWTNTTEAVEAEATNRSLSRAAFARRIGHSPR